jgi:hypothetical protein
MPPLRWFVWLPAIVVLLVLWALVGESSSSLAIEKDSAHRESLAHKPSVITGFDPTPEPFSAAQRQGNVSTQSNTRIQSNDHKFPLIDSFHQKMQSARLPDEKKILMFDLAEEYQSIQSSAAKDAIRAVFRRLITDSQDREDARLATLLYSRLAHFDDTIEILEKSHAAGLMNDEALFRELAIHLTHVTARSQAEGLELMRRIIKADTELGRVFLFDDAKSPAFHQYSSFEMKQELMAYVLQSKPSFGGWVGQPGYHDVIRYEQWFEAYVALDHYLTHKSPAMALTGLFERFPLTDPREAMALFRHPIYEILIESLPTSALKARIDELARDYVQTYPNSVLVNDLEPEALRRLQHR